MSKPLLSTRDLRVSYGGIEAVKGLSLDLYEGELVSLIGANGAGKTTTIKAICGLIVPSGGQIDYLGQAVTSMAAWQLVSQGLVMVARRARYFCAHEH